MELKKPFTIAILISVLLLGYWEFNARSNGYIAAIDDNKALWVENFAQIENSTKKDVVFLGSSRVHFDIQLDEWEATTGVRPIMLANDGTTPTPVFQEIVNNTDFNGTVIIGITPPLFFTPNIPQLMFWERALARIHYIQDETYAQRLNHLISIPLENTFAFMNAAEEAWVDDIDLKTILSNIKMGDRVVNPMPPFYNFCETDRDRNITMFEKTKTDTAFANTIKKVWYFYGSGAPPAVKEPVIELYNQLIPKIEARGGKVIFVRCPSSGGFRYGENLGMPKKDFYDEFIKQTNSVGFHFEDYAVLNKYTCPEESHLYTPDAKQFTIDLAKIMIKEGVITNLKAN